MRDALLKKGFEKQVVVIMILMLIAILVYFLFFLDFSSKANATIKKEMCKDSVRKYSIGSLGRIKVMGQDVLDALGSPVKLKCVTEYEKSDEKEDEKINKHMAGKMFDCWDMFLGGEKEIFASETGNYCVVCSVTEFTSGKETSKGFLKYMLETEIPARDETYFEFIYKKNSESLLYNPDIEKNDFLDLTKKQAVVFTMTKDIEISKLMTMLIGAPAGALVIIPLAIVGGPLTIMIAAGGVAGSAIGYFIGSSNNEPFDSGILIYPYDELKNLKCTVLEGKSTYIQIMQEAGQ